MDLDRSNSLIKFLQNYLSTVYKAVTYTSLFSHGTFAKTLTLSEKFNSSKIFCGWLQSPFQHGACKCRQLDLSQSTAENIWISYKYEILLIQTTWLNQELCFKWNWNQSCAQQKVLIYRPLTIFLLQAVSYLFFREMLRGVKARVCSIKFVQTPLSKILDLVQTNRNTFVGKSWVYF